MNRSIIIKGAGENNLQNIDLTIPCGGIVAFAGVSGSGKSSLVFDTIAVTSNHQLYDVFPLHIRNRMPYGQEPKVDVVENLSAAIVIDQRPFSGNARSSVGTMTEIAPLLRLLFSRFSEQRLPVSGAYSFNDPQGMCPHCGGMGGIICFDMEKVIDKEKSLNQEAIRLPGFAVDSYQWQTYANSGLFDNDKPLKEYSDKEWKDLLHGSGFAVDIKNNTGKVWDNSYKLTYEGLLDRMERLHLKKAGSNVGKVTQKILKEFTTQTVCPVCHGKRLSKKALASRFLGYSIWELGQMEVTELLQLFKGYTEEPGREILEKIIRGLQDIVDMGLGYLNLNRSTTTLSGGETQRLKIVRHLRSSLVCLTYIFDEPSVGLHPKDIDRLNKLLIRLKNRGNTVLLVEHDRNVLKIADEIIEMGPGAGKNGGKVVFRGTMQELQQRDTLTGKWLRQPICIKQTPRHAKGYIPLHNCNLNNLQQISVVIPRGVLTVVSGLAGSGKTSLVCGELLRQYPEIIHISQKNMGASSRSHTATYIGIMDSIRKIFAKENGKKPAAFSRNGKGACTVCGGTGMVTTEMAFLHPVSAVCEACDGSGYKKEVLEWKYQGKTIAEVMAMTVEEAMPFFSQPAIHRKLQDLQEVGLGYISLGQTTITMSGGERQRLKLAAHLKATHNIYVMDEPTTGLHGNDVMLLLKLLDKLIEKGNTVIVVEHDLDVIARADYVIDMGPEGGKNGGHVLFEGTVKDLLDCKNSYTAEYLRKQMATTEKK